VESIPGLHKSLKIPALAGRYGNPITTRFLAPIDCLKIPAALNVEFMRYCTNLQNKNKVLQNFILLRTSIFTFFRQFYKDELSVFCCMQNIIILTIL
jgi:hypothetical protein